MLNTPFLEFETAPCTLHRLSLGLLTSQGLESARNTCMSVFGFLLVWSLFQLPHPNLQSKWDLQRSSSVAFLTFVLWTTAG